MKALVDAEASICSNGGFRWWGQVKPMADESPSNDPPQLAYQVGFALAIILLGVTMFKYPLW